MRYEDVKGRDRYVLADLMAAAEAQLRAWPGEIDGIAAYWDFPAVSLAALLSHRHGTPAPSLAAVLACEHKYWSRLVQREVTAAIPAFALVDPFDIASLESAEVPLPAWIKPVKAYASQLAFRVTSPAELHRAAAAIRAGIARFAEPVDELLARVSPPAEVARLGGWGCVLEEEVGGRQATVEGYVLDREVCTYGVVDSWRFPGRSSFERYQYPSMLPASVQQRMRDIAARVVGHLGLRWSPFNAEFFFDPASGHVRLLEVNPRFSQSHSELFELVDGTSNLQVMADVASGRAPHIARGDGCQACAARLFVRTFHRDAWVTAVPNADELERLAELVPGSQIRLRVHAGMRLGELRDQEPYSRTLATVVIGAASPGELERKRRALLSRLSHHLRLAPAPSVSTVDAAILTSPSGPAPFAPGRPTSGVPAPLT